MISIRGALSSAISTNVGANNFWHNRVPIVSTLLWTGSIIMIAYIVKKALSSKDKPPENDLSKKKVTQLHPSPLNSPLRPTRTRKTTPEHRDNSVPTNTAATRDVGTSAMPPAPISSSNSEAPTLPLNETPQTPIYTNPDTKTVATSTSTLTAKKSTEAQIEETSSSTSTQVTDISEQSPPSFLNNQVTTSTPIKPSPSLPLPTLAEDTDSSNNNSSLNNWVNEAADNFIDRLHPQPDDNDSSLFPTNTPESNSPLTATKQLETSIPIPATPSNTDETISQVYTPSIHTSPTVVMADQPIAQSANSINTNDNEDADAHSDNHQPAPNAALTSQQPQATATHSDHEDAHNQDDNQGPASAAALTSQQQPEFTVTGAQGNSRSGSPTPSISPIGLQPLTPVKGQEKKNVAKVAKYSSISVGHFDFENPFQGKTDSRDLSKLHAQFPYDLKVYMRDSEKDSKSIDFSDKLASQLEQFGWAKEDQNQILSLLLQENLYSGLIGKALDSEEAKKQLPQEILDLPLPIFDGTKKPTAFIRPKTYAKPTKMKLTNLFYEKSNYVIQCIFSFTEKLQSSSSFVLWKNVKHPLRSFELPSVINNLHSPKGFCSIVAKEHTVELSLDNPSLIDSETFKANKKYCKTDASALSKAGWLDFTIPHIHRLLSAEALWEKLKKPILDSLPPISELSQLNLNQACFSKDQKDPGIYLNDSRNKQIVIKNVFFKMGNVLIQGCFLLKILDSSTEGKTNFQVKSWHTVWIKGSDPLHALSGFSKGSTITLTEV